jgi:hypothetical protein
MAFPIACAGNNRDDRFFDGLLHKAIDTRPFNIKRHFPNNISLFLTWQEKELKFFIFFGQKFLFYLIDTGGQLLYKDQ